MRILLSILLSLFILQAHAEEIVFEMSAFGIKFGKMTVTKTQLNDSTVVYSLSAKGYLKFLGIERKDETQNIVKYCNGRLVSSMYRQTENGVLKKWSDIYYDGGQLQIKSNTGKRNLSIPPALSVIMLYFNNPQKSIQLFNESDGVTLNLETSDKLSYTSKLPGGNKNVYRYTKEGIREVEYHLAIATVYARRL